MNKHEKAAIQKTIQDDSLAKAAKILIANIINPKEQIVMYRDDQVIINEDQVRKIAEGSSALLGTFSSESVVLVAKSILEKSAISLSSRTQNEEDYSI